MFACLFLGGHQCVGLGTLRWSSNFTCRRKERRHSCFVRFRENWRTLSHRSEIVAHSIGPKKAWVQFESSGNNFSPWVWNTHVHHDKGSKILPAIPIIRSSIFIPSTVVSLLSQLSLDSDVLGSKWTTVRHPCPTSSENVEHGPPRGQVPSRSPFEQSPPPSAKAPPLQPLPFLNQVFPAPLAPSPLGQYPSALPLPWSSSFFGPFPHSHVPLPLVKWQEWSNLVNTWHYLIRLFTSKLAHLQRFAQWNKGPVEIPPC